MKKIGFITYKKLPNLASDEQYLIPLLKKKSILIEPIIWGEPLQNLSNFDALIFRSPWDYFQRFDEFTNWFESLKTSTVPIFNSLDIIRKNMDKHYLLELENQGIQICKSILLEKGSKINLTEIANENNWLEMVIKPTISGAAYQTFRFNSNEIHKFQPIVNNLLETKAIIIQPYMSEITSFGEISLLFINKKFSHAILKCVKNGDFRVQSEFGGTTTPYKPNISEVEFGYDVISKISEDLLYARVDFIISNNKYYLMELELFEPSLYLFSDEAKIKFSNAIETLI